MTVLLRPTGLDITASEAMCSPDLFAAHFDGPSWNCWRSVVKAAFGEPMTDDELRLFREVAGRDPPLQRVRELVAAIGRGGGKDLVYQLPRHISWRDIRPSHKASPRRARLYSLHRGGQGTSQDML